MGIETPRRPLFSLQNANIFCQIAYIAIQAEISLYKPKRLGYAWIMDGGNGAAEIGEGIMETKTLTRDEIVEWVSDNPDAWDGAVMTACAAEDAGDGWYETLSQDADGELLAAVVASEVESEDELDSAIAWEAKKIIRVAMAAAEMGRKGGSAKSERKTRTARENGRRGGRPNCGL